MSYPLATFVGKSLTPARSEHLQTVAANAGSATGILVQEDPYTVALTIACVYDHSLDIATAASICSKVSLHK